MSTPSTTGSPSGGGPVHPISPGRVDLASEGDVAYWLKVFDTTHEALAAAVEAVGDDAAAVADYFDRGSDAQPTPVPQIPDGG